MKESSSRCCKCGGIDTNTYHCMDDDWYYCCKCGCGDFDEVASCTKCGEWIDIEDMYSGFCGDCIEYEATKIDNAFEYGEARKECVEINGFYKWVLGTNKKIEDIVQEYIHENIPLSSIKGQASEYCMDDMMDFAEWLSENY